MVHFAKNSNFQSTDFLHFFAKHKKIGIENDPSKEK